MEFTDIDPNFGMEHNIEREKRLAKHVTAAAKQIPQARAEKTEGVDTDLNLFCLTFPADTEINKIAMHYVYCAAYACDKFVTAFDAESGRMQFLFYIDMASPYV